LLGATKHLISTGLGLMAIKPFVRSYSTHSIKKTINKSEMLAKEHIDSGKPTTHLVINNILLNQNLSNSKEKLEELLKVKGVELDLPVGDDKTLLNQLTGNSKYKGFMGVYIFIHKATGQKYVGSSNLLRRRMEYYFKNDFPLIGKFLPLLHKDGLKAFKLIIFKLDSTKFNSKDALYLEQYYLLHKEFNLNTLRVVNAGSSKGNGVYIYDLSCSTLYYHANSQIELKRILRVHPETCKKYIDTGKPYLGKFILLSYYISTANIGKLTVDELLEIMQTNRKDAYVLATRKSVPVNLEILKGNTFVDPSLIDTTLNFNSLTSCIDYLNKLGIDIKREILLKYIKNEKEFYNFLCKYSDKFMPMPEIELMIEEYKKLKVDLDTVKINNKNKPLLVKGKNFEMEFDSILDTVKYFKGLGIDLDRKTLNIKINNGNEYKGYIFSYKYKKNI